MWVGSLPAVEIDSDKTGLVKEEGAVEDVACPDGEVVDRGVVEGANVVKR